MPVVEKRSSLKTHKHAYVAEYTRDARLYKRHRTREKNRAMSLMWHMRLTFHLNSF